MARWNCVFSIAEEQNCEDEEIEFHEISEVEQEVDSKDDADIDIPEWIY